MNVNIDVLDDFQRNFKRLKKKYKSLVNDYSDLLDSLRENPTLGVSLGMGAHKVRMAILSKGGGKSGGARVITYVVNEEAPDTFNVTLLTIYDKSEQANIPDGYLNYLVGLAKERK